jgi:asparagine synthase (glutamine-hydrolysing)
MCGIAGVAGSVAASRSIEAMTLALRHRGPDGMGKWSRGSTAFGATRLAIIDPAAPAQPMAGLREDVCIVFNGEIYNHRELRRELQLRGVRFQTQTDTEVVLRLYEAEGADCVLRLQGMFAFAVLDRDRVFLARDRLGIKPLYHALAVGPQGAPEFVFASEIKALLRHPGVTPRLDMQAFADSLVIGYPTGEATFFEGIHSLRPGHTMTVLIGPPLEVGEPRAYHVRSTARDDGITIHDAEDLLEGQLQQAVDSHLAADVEVGLTLSGGLDSALLGMFAALRLKRPLATFTVGDHESYADVVQAAQVAQMIGSRHDLLMPGFDDYLAAIPALVEAEEQPSSLYALPFLLLCRRVASRVKACLHGEGADELFGGYSEYLNRESRLAHIGQRLPVLRQLGVRLSDGALQTIQRLSSPSTFEAYLPNVFEVNLADALERQHLMPVDKCAMAASLEMRVPYLDDGMLALMGRVPLAHLVRPDIAVRKYLLRRLALKRFGMQALDVVLREKLGAPVAGILLLDRFDRLCNERLPEDYLTGHEFGRCFTAKRQLLMFDLFCEVFITHRGESDAVGGVLDFIAARAGVRASEVIPA